MSSAIAWLYIITTRRRSESKINVVSTDCRVYVVENLKTAFIITCSGVSRFHVIYYGTLLRRLICFYTPVISSMTSLLCTTVQSKLPSLYATTCSNFITKGDFESLTKDERCVSLKYQYVIKTLTHTHKRAEQQSRRRYIKEGQSKTYYQNKLATRNYNYAAAVVSTQYYTYNELRMRVFSSVALSDLVHTTNHEVIVETESFDASSLQLLYIHYVFTHSRNSDELLFLHNSSEFNFRLV